jgi:hypothetical protein
MQIILCINYYFVAQDKGNLPWWLGMSPKGVGVYDHSDKTKPRKVSVKYLLKGLSYHIWNSQLCF